MFEINTEMFFMIHKYFNPLRSKCISVPGAYIYLALWSKCTQSVSLDKWLLSWLIVLIKLNGVISLIIKTLLKHALAIKMNISLAFFFFFSFFFIFQSRQRFTLRFDRQLFCLLVLFPIGRHAICTHEKCGRLTNIYSYLYALKRLNVYLFESWSKNSKKVDVNDIRARNETNGRV